MKIKIKKAKIQDWKIILDIQKKDGFLHPYYLTKERIKILFKRGELFFLAFINDIPVGFSSVDLEIRAYLHFLSVDKNHTHKGIGSTLLNTIFREVIMKNYNDLHTYVETNSPIESFLQKFGFQKIGYYKNRYGLNKDASIWRMQLLQQDKLQIKNSKGLLLSANIQIFIIRIKSKNIQRLFFCMVLPVTKRKKILCL